jgi:drug/metabolite transporter (DMT)-like permease
MATIARAEVSSPQPIGRSSALLALLVSALWGGNVVALKLSLTLFAPFWSAWWRMLLGVVTVGAWARTRRVALSPDPGEPRSLVVLGFLFTAQIALLNLGANLTSPAYAVVLLNSHPIFSNLLGHFVASEQRLSTIRVMGLAVAFGGICYLSLGRPVPSLASDPLLGNFLLIGSALLLGVRTVYTRWLVQSIEPERALVWQMSVSLPFFLLLGMGLEAPLLKPFTPPPVLAVVYQGTAVAGFCFVIWTWLLRRHAAGALSVFAFTVPFFGVLLSALLFSEPITGRVLLAAALVTTGIAIVTRQGQPASD